MKPDQVEPQSGIRLIGEPVDYADGSEERMLGVLENATDRRSASDELAAHISDWPSRYHLSRLRANLLRPLRFGPGLRVLDAGAGTGALTRHVAETGAQVVAVEGTLARARATAARCEGMGNVEVVCGPIEALVDHDGFDVVLCVGLLEYRGVEAPELLARLRGLTRPGGALVLAIENQLGLRYLLGYGEDHLGEAWVGVEGYLAQPGVRTFPRRRLAEELSDAGFGAQHWLFPFPDYKLPSAVVAETAYSRPDGARFVDQMVGWPCSAEASQPLRVCDDRWAHRVFLDAGLGPDVANSFLVVAGAGQEAVDRLVTPGAQAWFFGRDRLRVWLRSKQFGEGQVEIRGVDSAPVEHQRGWLRQDYPARDDRVQGTTVEQLALDALSDGPDAVGAVLGLWRRHLAGVEVAAQPAVGGHGRSAGPGHPFRPDDSERLMPPDHLDVDLGNFVVDESGDLTYIDREWVAPSEVDAVLARVRALWWFAVDLVQHAVVHPWPRRSTVDELTEVLGLLADTPVTARDLDRWRAAEAEMQAKVTGEPVETLHAALAELGGSSQFSPAVHGRLPFTTLRRELAAVAAGAGALHEAVDALRERERVLEEALEAAGQQRDAAQEAYEATRAHAEIVSGALEAERAEKEALAVVAARWDDRFASRLRRRLRRLLDEILK